MREARWIKHYQTLERKYPAALKLVPGHATLGSKHGRVIEVKSVLTEPVDVIPRNTEGWIKSIKKELCG
jgi:hypothetical protein